MPAGIDGKARKIAIAGAGPVAQAMGRALRECGIPIPIDYAASRDRLHAEAAAAFIGGGCRPSVYSELPGDASHVLVAVSDRAIASVAGALADVRGGLRVALHTCGSYGTEVLAPLTAAGVSCGSIHPLQTIREPSQGAVALRGAAYAICGDPDALLWAEELAASLGGRILHIAPERRSCYHAAAVMASNYVAALLDAAEQLMLLAGVPKEDALAALAPLVRTTVENVMREGAVNALTGPVVRGDAATVCTHAQAMKEAEQSIAGLYRAAGLHALDMARKRGLGEEDAEKVAEALFARK